ARAMRAPAARLRNPPMMPGGCQRSPAVNVWLGQCLAQSPAQALLTDGLGLAFRVVAARAVVDCPLTFDALDFQRRGLTHVSFFIRRTTSSCMSRPTRRPSEVVIGAFSILCSSMKCAISLSGTNGGKVLGPGRMAVSTS